jgi:hypothetical protein
MPNLPQAISTENDILAYISAWTSLPDHNKLCFMNFSPGGKPVCVDSGASCCISNNRSDFITFTTSANSVLSGIASGFHIEGKGCWETIKNNIVQTNEFCTVVLCNTESENTF